MSERKPCGCLLDGQTWELCDEHYDAFIASISEGGQ